MKKKNKSHNMIEQVNIKNFKSIYDVTFSPSRINVFIGENGSGKSNLLEALVFASASDANKLDNEFLTSRGLRTTESNLMRSAFAIEENDDKVENNNNIKIKITFDNDISRLYELSNNDESYSSWENIKLKQKNEINTNLETYKVELDNLLKTLNSIKTDKKKTIAKKILLDSVAASIDKIQLNVEHQSFYIQQLNASLNNFIIYSPENTALRNFYQEGQIEPLGINGEGLLRLINVISNYDDKNYINEILSSLKLFNWFESIDIPDNLSLANHKMIIKDKFLSKNFDQRSANEGFLFILFYITLMVAKETPKSFAIDNIDASLNPALCTKLMKLLASLAKKYDKQVFFTTHNPAILDGIDLTSNEQRLYKVDRNKSGYTRVKQITAENKPTSINGESLKLSEAFLRGYLGGLPKGF